MVVLALAFALPMSLPPLLTAARADDRRDHERALAARARGEVLAMETLLAAAERAIGGRAIDVDFDFDDGVPVYEFELLLPDGRVIELEVDARDGRWRKLEGARLETLFAAGTSTPRPVAPATPAAPGASTPGAPPDATHPPATSPTDKRLPPRPPRGEATR